MDEVQTFLETAIPEDVALAIAELACLAFGVSGTAFDKRMERMRSAPASTDLEVTSGRRIVVLDGARAVAHARTFVRVVHVADQSLPVLALATVCTHPDVRGQGLGAEVTRSALQLVGQPSWPEVSLFQTPVAAFYEKLHCQVIDNRFVNRQNLSDPESSPWQDPGVMVYPATYNWPNGTVDLNGEGY